MFSYSRHTKAKIRSYIIPPIITALALLLMMVVRGIYPFGQNQTGYYDVMHQIVPVYTLIWDVLHGEASLLYSLEIGLGTDLTSMTSAFSMFSPFNLLLYLVPRSAILGFIPIATIVKCASMSVTMYFLLNHCRIFSSTQYSLKTLFSIMYALCGYTIVYSGYYNPWMDMMVFFPILMLAYYKMMDTGSKTFYIVMTAICLVINCELGLIAVIYMIILTGIYTIFALNTDEAKTIYDKMALCGSYAGNMLTGTMAGAGIAACVLFPYLNMMFRRWGVTEHRAMLNYIGLLLDESGTYYSSSLQRFMMLYGLGFALALSIVGIAKYRKEKQKTILFSIINVIMMLSLFFDEIAVIWNLETQNGYQQRFGFIIAFTINASGCYYAGKPMERKGHVEDRFDVHFDPLERLVFLLAGMVACGIAAYAYNKINLSNEKEALIFYVIVFAFLFVIDIGVCLYNKGMFKAKSCYICVAVEIFIALYGFTGIAQFADRPMGQYYNYVATSNELSSSFNVDSVVTNRIKNADSSLGPNYSIIMQCSAISENFDSYTEESSAARWWGYSVNEDGAMDTGGTVFSDAFLNVTKVISTQNMDEELYRKVKSEGYYNLYEPRYILPFGISIDSKTLEGARWGNLVEDSNIIYSSMMGKENVIAEQLDCEEEFNSYTIHVGAKQAVYIQTETDEPVVISVNGMLLEIPTYGNLSNTNYPAANNNGLVYIGTFEDEDVDVLLEGASHKVNMEAVGIDISKLNTICNMFASNPKTGAQEIETKLGNTIKFRQTKYKNRDMIVVPVTYNPNWNVTVNGEKVMPISIGNGIMMGIMLADGENVIKMTYIPQGFILGLTTSVLLASLIMGMCYAFRKREITVDKRLKAAANVLFLLIWTAIMLVVIVFPMIAAFL